MLGWVYNCISEADGISVPLPIEQVITNNNKIWQMKRGHTEARACQRSVSGKVITSTQRNETETKLKQNWNKTASFSCADGFTDDLPLHSRFARMRCAAPNPVKVELWRTGVSVTSQRYRHESVGDVTAEKGHQIVPRQVELAEINVLPRAPVTRDLSPTSTNPEHHHHQS